MSRASAVASTSSIARATMLRYGLTEISPASPVRRRAAAAIGCSRSPARVILAIGPRRYAAPSRPRACKACDQATCSSLNSDCQSVGARSRPSPETIRPSFIGYSVGWRSATRRPSRAKSGVSRPATRSTVRPAISRAVVNSAFRARISARRKDREKPPTRTDTGWIARPPMSSTIRLPAFLRVSPDSTAARWSWAISRALAYPRKSGRWSR